MVRVNKNNPLPLFISINKIKGHYPEHRLDYYEFSLIISGNGVESINGQTHPIIPGTVSLIYPHQIHEITCAENCPEIILYSCSFDMNVLLDFKQLGEYFIKNNNDILNYFHFTEPQKNELELKFEDMRTEFNGDSLWNINMIEARLLECLIMFDRFRRINVEESAPHSYPSGNTHMWEIIHFVQRNYMDNLTLQHVSEKFNVSNSYLSTSFKKYVGQNFINYLHDLRINQATSLLLSTDMLIIDISTEVGFKSSKTFARVFKEVTGFSPAVYRKEYLTHK